MVSLGLLALSAVFAFGLALGVARARGLRKGGVGCGRRQTWR